MMHRFLCGYFFFLLVFCGAAARMQSRKRGPPRPQNDLVRFTGRDIYFQASSVEATFRDGSHETFESDSIRYNSTTIGDYLQFTTLRRKVRLYFIPPTLDWKQNETYQWKLNQAWMSDDYYGWIFWNVNGYIDSEIQLSSSNQVFQCNHVEFSFWKNAPKGMFDGNQGKLVLKNVNMAAFLSPQHNEESLTTFSPCSGTCRAINGSITCATGDYWKYGATIVSFLVAVFITKIASRGPATRRSRYSPVDGQDEATANDYNSVEDRNDDHDNPEERHE
jgi:hypothetical protein